MPPGRDRGESENRTPALPFADAVASRRREGAMKDRIPYFLLWLLGVPATALVIAYVATHL